MSLTLINNETNSNKQYCNRLLLTAIYKTNFEIKSIFFQIFAENNLSPRLPPAMFNVAVLNSVAPVYKNLMAFLLQNTYFEPNIEKQINTEYFLIS